MNKRKRYDLAEIFASATYTRIVFSLQGPVVLQTERPRAWQSLHPQNTVFKKQCTPPCVIKISQCERAEPGNLPPPE
jgi:hypothetical protein